MRVLIPYLSLQQEKCLHLRSEFYPPGGLTRPPTGRLVAGSDLSSVSSEDGSGTRPASDSRFSFSSATADLKSPGSESDLVFTSYTPKVSPSPVVTTVPPAQQQQPKVSPSPVVTTIPPAQQQRATPPSSQQQRATPTSSQQQRGTPTSGKMDDDDFGMSLMAELSSFGSILDSFGISGTTSSASSGPKSPPPSSSSTLTSVSASYSTPAGEVGGRG